MPVDSYEFRLVKTYKLQMETNTGANTYAKYRHTYPELGLPSLKVLHSEMADLAGISSTAYHCCADVCVCFVGAFADLDACPICNKSRYKANGQPANIFNYISLIDQLQALYAGRTSAEAMRHRALNHDNHTNDPLHTISDIYDSELYRRLRTEHVVVNGRILPHKYFDGNKDVLLLNLTDGFQVFKRSGKTCWPLLYLNCNLHENSRFHFANVICVGIIPGPKKPKNFDSFMYLPAQELNKLAVGVLTFDALDRELFTMRAFAPFGCADLPAAAAAHTGAKAPGAKRGCRACPIEGIRILGTRNQSHYLPLIRPPGYPPLMYDYDNLPPLRIHHLYLAQAREVDLALTDAEMKRLSMLYGINGTPMTALIPGTTFPWSFPFDLMHLIENMCKNYLLLFTGNFKGLNAGQEDYILPKDVLREIGEATVASNATIPAQFGRPLPNPVEERAYYTAEAYVNFFVYVAPIVFRRRFSRPKYYRHLCRFISIIKSLMAFTSTAEQRVALRAEIKLWYQEWEE